MNQAITQSAAFPIVRARVRNLLTRSPAFRSLPKAQRDELAHDMVKVASYIVGGETGDNLPSAATLASNDATSGAELPGNLPGPPEKTAGESFTPSALTAGAGEIGNVINAINFPNFVAGLIDGVFTAIVDSSIQQMQQYAELVKNVAKSVDQFMKDNVSENQARDYLVNQYPDHLELNLEGEQPTVQPREDSDPDSLPDFFSDLGLDMEMPALDEENVEQTLVPAARRRMAMDRQQLLATMVLMGINRIVVTDGRIQASVVFELDTRDLVQRSFEQTAEQHGSKSQRTRPGFWGWFQPSQTRESSYGRFKVTTVQEEDSEAQTEMKVNLKGNVDLRFKSETFPLERMTDILTVTQIQDRAPAGMRPPPPGQPSKERAPEPAQ